jgi:uncharacterized membrane protein (DUF485 family)
VAFPRSSLTSSEISTLYQVLLVIDKLSFAVAVDLPFLLPYLLFSAIITFYVHFLLYHICRTSVVHEVGVLVSWSSI